MDRTKLCGFELPEREKQIKRDKILSPGRPHSFFEPRTFSKARSPHLCLPPYSARPQRKMQNILSLSLPLTFPFRL
jgi:hypothetical protein